MSNTYWLNKLLLTTGIVSHRRYHSSAHKVDVIQQQKLLRYLANNATTDYGKKYHFASIKSYASFAAHVPVVDDWKQLEDYIEQIKNGEQNVLCFDKIDAFEETSGSTGFSKLIPYNKSLRREFQTALQVWLPDLYRTLPQAFYGKAYWSLSPVLKETKYTASGIRIGLENDADYFNPLVKFFLSQTMAVDPDLIKIKETEAFYFETIKQLLLQKNLSLISVWSPTFFLRLDEFLRSHFDSLLQHISRIDTTRYHELIQATGSEFTWKQLWSNLSCISCWTDAQAAFWMPQVQRAAGDVFIQPKGLLSTEAVISIPVRNMPYPALAYQSHFFEFRDVADGNIHLAHQLQNDASYEVIVTTAGGLYRYTTKDMIRVCGFYKQVPLFRFLGRKNRTSDIAGEKINELQVNEIISELFKNETVKTVFIRPERVAQSGRYILYAEEEKESNCWQEITKQFENRLCQNPYYKHALATGQLLPMQYKRLEKGFGKKLTAYYTEKKMMQEGNIKLPVLMLADELQELNHYL